MKTAACQLCPACGAAESEELGPLPRFPLGAFCGQKIKVQLLPGTLRRCKQCSLQYRFPVWDEEELTKLYENLPDGLWDGCDERCYWSRIKQVIENHVVGRSILDVGCFAGDFLQWLPDEWKKHGVEPSLAAAKQAQARGIEILGHTAADLENCNQRFDVVVSFDVIEHLTQPLQFVTNLKRVLKPDGILVIMTGATDAWPYRLFGRHFWYGSFPEHVSFYSASWFAWLAVKLNMELMHYSRFSSEPRSWFLWLRQFAQISLHTFIQIALEKGFDRDKLRKLPFFGRAADWPVVPWWKQASDHGLVVLKNVR